METAQVPAPPGTRRAFVAHVDRCEWRDSGNGRDLTLTGHAAVFGVWSEPLSTWAGTFRERIAPGAFEDALANEPDVRALFNHDPNYVLGRTRSGTLELSEDDTGLRVWARVPPTGWASDLRESMSRGDIDQMSFAFTVSEDEWHEDKDEETVERTILRVGELFDVSVVTYPAYPQTDATLRCLDDAITAGRLEQRRVIPFKATPKADEGSSWNGPAEVARADVADLRAMCTWYDPADKNDDGDLNKSAFKLPHHRADASHPVVLRGVQAAMQRLMGTDIPESDMKGCHAHLAGHYRQFDREPPDFDEMMHAARAGDDETLRRLADPDPAGAEPAAPDDPAGGLEVARLKARARVRVAQAKARRQ